MVFDRRIRAGPATVAGTIVGTVALFGVLLVAGMRWKVRRVLDAVRRLNRSVTNPLVLQTAGSVGTQTSVIQHLGRSSGRKYDTPVDTIPTATGFLIALPYGMRADWLRNVLRAGSATVLTQGERVDVHRPAIVATSDVANAIPRRTLRTLRLFGVNYCLHVDRNAPRPDRTSTGP